MCIRLKSGYTALKSEESTPISSKKEQIQHQHCKQQKDKIDEAEPVRFVK